MSKRDWDANEQYCHSRGNPRSCPGLTRASTGTSVQGIAMDCRVKPGNDNAGQRRHNSFSIRPMFCFFRELLE